MYFLNALNDSLKLVSKSNLESDILDWDPILNSKPWMLRTMEIKIYLGCCDKRCGHSALVPNEMFHKRERFLK